MSSRTVYTCDGCGLEVTNSYKARGWRRVWYGGQTIATGYQTKDDKGHACSLPCEIAFVARKVLAPLQDELDTLNKENDV